MSRVHLLILGAVLTCSGATATACINDNESPTHEREFRSQYGGLVQIPSQDQSLRRPARLDLLMGGGVAMLAGSVVLIAKRSRARI